MWRWWEAAEPTEQCSTVSLACFLLYLTHSNTSYISHLIYNRAQRARSFCNFTSSGMESQWRSLITFGWIKLMSLFVQFLKTYGPVRAPGLELRAGALPDSHSFGSHSTSSAGAEHMLMILSCCRKGGMKNILWRISMRNYENQLGYFLSVFL